ncbi:TRAP transporter large permease subunit [Stackebrandtia nassauensis]|uniref:TRAP C4-dicarboxylate transport system permease DctM subunit n=1 Tax=Stackebrandtia nassauensis (strain DSM 44728 / CIP 108903 / NRRL B-16338 / NBRC 102104 / LLR-40K-21) TaxID=446470 RepID=D3PX62_STANL|nr:TRAP transporter large permease subunit [Stackebrandtia nassauensis]ADD41325.1 TRAP C4-dicarboxylate transport system permease DctM subunit [Stackebrandtia nassauensis DSM 44728]
MLGIWALVAYIVVIIAWNGLLKRNIGEAMIIGFVAVAAFGGGSILEVGWAGIKAAATEEIVFAALTFVFMGFVLSKTGVVDQLIAMLNSLLGKRRGGAGYVSTIAAAMFGAVSGSGSGNAAAVGSVTIPWMAKSNFSPKLSATVVAGNAGLGIAIPPSSSLFILTGSAAVASYVTADQLFLALFAGGAWTLLYRLVLMFYFVRRDKIGAVDPSMIEPFGRTFAAGWSSLLVFVGIIVPVLLTSDLTSDAVISWIGEAPADAISIITWIPVLVTIIGLILGRRALPRRGTDWWKLLGEVGPRYAVIGATLFFAFAAAATLTELGLAEQLAKLLGELDAPAFIVSMVVGLLVVGVAAPLTGTATIAAIGPVAFTTLMSAGVSPIPAAVAILIFASTEGASPPGAAPIYIASGISGVNPARTFVPLVVWYVLPILVIGSLVAIGALPV